MTTVTDDPGDAADRALRSLALPPGFDSGDDILTSFYVPALSRATSYDRSVGYFRSSSLATAARGMSRFISSGGTIRLLVGAELTAADADALQGATTIPPDLAARLRADLATENDLVRQRLAVLAWLVKQGRLEIQVAVAVDDDGSYLVGDDDPFFHEKIGVLRDDHGDGIAFQGSINESDKALTRNFESFSVFPSWSAASHFDHWAHKFDERWHGNVPRYRVLPLPDVVHDGLLHYAPPAAPPERDPEEPGPSAPRELLARYLQVAPRLPTAQRLAQDTVPLEPFPHQQQVVERLAGMYPRSWLVADEVGLGKTISGGLALRRLLLTGQVQRALILAPANVAQQWQDELFEKFGLWVPRLERGRIHGAHPDDVRPLGPEENPYAAEPVLIASSHLARRRDQRDLVLDAAPFDLLVVDEAHHARRRSFADLAKYRPSLLLSLLDDLHEAGKTRTTWLLTATPMQVHPIELLDLLKHVGLTGRLASWPAFQQLYAELTKADGAKIDWRTVQSHLRETPLPPPGPVEEELLTRIRNKLGVVTADRIAKFVDAPGDANETAADLGPDGRAELREWLRLRSPVGQYVTRHSRETLKRYRDQGLLREPVADRDVADIDIHFTTEEKQLYDRLDSLIDRLLEAHGTKQNAGFVLTVYRRRLTSSWAAIRRSLHKRLAREADTAAQLELDAAVLEETATDDMLGQGIDEEAAVPLDDRDLEEIRGYLADIEDVPDTKFTELEKLIDEARTEGRALIVFTQFTDTLDAIRDRLVGAYGPELATYTGQGGRMWNPTHRIWEPVSKQDLVAEVRERRVTVVLANDAASEGLNLQTASFLVNYDLPWNPMRVEQRIGRIDRIGQEWPTVKVRNFTIPGTVEVDVHRALHGRIDAFHDLVGKLQPILGATERAVRDAYSADRADRAAAVDAEVQGLLEQVDELEATGIDFVDEDPLPIPDHPASPVTTSQLHDLLAELGIELADQNRPVVWTANASRDVTDWSALATYGHPRFDPALDKIADGYDQDTGTVIFHEDGPIATAMRADRSPPEQVASVRDLLTLGHAYARDDAQAEAERTATALARERHAAYAAVQSTRTRSARAALRSAFVEFANDLLAVRMAIRRLMTADDVDPAAIWFDLRNEPNELRYLETMAKRLQVPVSELLPTPREVDRYRDSSVAKLEAKTPDHLETFRALVHQATG